MQKAVCRCEQVVVIAYCKQSKTGAGEGVGTRLVVIQNVHVLTLPHMPLSPVHAGECYII